MSTSSTNDQPTDPQAPTVETLPVLGLPDGVVFPETVVTVSITTDTARTALAAATDDRILLVPHPADADGTRRYARVGVVAAIEDRGQLPDGTPAVTLRAVARAVVGAGVIGDTDALWVEAEVIDAHHSDEEPDEIDRLASEYRAAATSLLDALGGRRMRGLLRDVTDPSALADSITYWPELTNDRRIELLETLDLAERLRLATAWVKQALAEREVAERIRSEVSDDLEKTQREAILRRQLAAIQAELGEGDDDVIGRYRTRLAELDVPDTVVEAVTNEIDRLERLGGESMEANWIRTWLDTVFDLPWGLVRDDAPEVADARAILDADHTGLGDVKDRLVEYLAVRRLRAERGVDVSDDTTRGGAKRGGVILSLVGPPGVGKTSLGESIARALGRDFVRLALGGIRDEAEIRGHRRTYVGARPGRLVRALTEAGSMNPVVLLDEVDKVTGGWNGDPSAALLEVLDPAQNHSFRDHYLEFELDLSDVVFIATANVIENIPGPLLDRMEVITLDGYTAAEKADIARDHLVPRLIERNGLRPDELDLSDEVIAEVTDRWTREAGVRRLERLLDKLVRSAVTRIAGGESGPIRISPDELRARLGRAAPSADVEGRVDRPGIATGLAVTGAGGDVLFVETSLVPGGGEPLLTGQLGDVMKESAVIARSVVGANAERFGVELPDDERLHVHFPAGAVPKDGPSAGITMTTALVSLLSGRMVRPEVGMTGEVSLQGRVLPIGGVKQKLLAAQRAGLTEVILPIANGEDLDEVPEEVREALTIHLAAEIDEVLAIALAAPGEVDAGGSPAKSAVG